MQYVLSNFLRMFFEHRTSSQVQIKFQTGIPIGRPYGLLTSENAITILKQFSLNNCIYALFFYFPKKYINSFFYFVVTRVESLVQQTYRSSHRTCSIKKGVLENFTKFTGKHLRQSLFLNKVAGLRPATLFKKDSATGVFL